MRERHASSSLIASLGFLSLLVAGNVYASTQRLGPSIVFLFGALLLSVLAGLLYRLVAPTRMIEQPPRPTTFQWVIRIIVIVLSIGSLYLKDMGLPPYIYLSVLGSAVVIVILRVLMRKQSGSGPADIAGPTITTKSVGPKPWYK